MKESHPPNSLGCGCPQNVCDAAIGALVWWTLGFGIAMGTNNSRWIGENHFALKKDYFEGSGGYEYAFWLFQ